MLIRFLLSPVSVIMFISVFNQLFFNILWYQKVYWFCLKKIKLSIFTIWGMVKNIAFPIFFVSFCFYWLYHLHIWQWLLCVPFNHSSCYNLIKNNFLFFSFCSKCKLHFLFLFYFLPFFSSFFGHFYILAFVFFSGTPELWIYWKASPFDSFMSSGFQRLKKPHWKKKKKWNYIRIFLTHSFSEN